MLPIQIGVMAACVVLFVPMGLAGWHLSRNKMLFFSGALFITLAVGVHLTPYFPPISSFFLSSSSNPTTLQPSLPPLDVNERSHSSSRDNVADGCLSYLHDVSYFSTSRARDWDWDWIRSAPVVDCEFQKLSPSDAADLLNGSWVVVAGDSQARFFALSLLALLLDDIDSVAAHLFKRHSDYHTVIPQSGIQFDFVWAPYVTNLTDLLSEFKHNSTYPDVLIMGSGLWHMLCINDAFDYGVVLAKLKNSLQAFLPAFSSEKHVRSPQLFWIGMPTLINSMLNTEEKREKMANATCNAYLSRILHSKLLRHTGGPLLLLDIQRLTRSCGARCTEDGMHYVGAVYEAAVHIMLNALLIESHQKL